MRFQTFDLPLERKHLPGTLDVLQSLAPISWAIGGKMAQYFYQDQLVCDK